MAKNSDYWKGRFEQLEEASHKKAEAVYASIENSYIQAQREIESKINNWYVRFANNNQITINEAKRLLNSQELKELKWDIQEYIKYGKENRLNDIWMKELENASAKYHISRLESLKIQTQQSMEVLFGNQLDEIDKMATNIYSDEYYHSCYELQKGFNIGWKIASIDENKLQKIISKPWAIDGKNFSERIWGNKTKMVNELHNQLTIMCVQGKSPDNAIKYMSKKFNTSKSQAGNLVMTESAYFSSLAQKDCFNDLDVEKYENVATLDSHTSAICQDMDGTVFDMNNFEPGVTAPPFHNYCRTTTVPHFDDDYDFVGERAARDDKGNTYHVPDNLKYKDWYNKYVVDGKELKNQTKNVKMKEEPKYNSFSYDKILSKYKGNDELIKNAFDNAELDESTYKMLNNIDKLDEVNIIKGKKSNFGIGIYENEISMTSMKDINTFYHEWMHSIDYMTAYKKDYATLGKDFKWISENLQEVRIATANKINNTIPQNLVDIMNSQRNRIKNQLEENMIKSGKLDKIVQKTINTKYSKSWNSIGSSTQKYIIDDISKREMQKELNKIINNDMEYKQWGCLADMYDAITSGKATNANVLIAKHGEAYYSDKSIFSLAKEGKNHKENTEMIANFGEMKLGKYKEQINWLKNNDNILYDKLEETYKIIADTMGEL